MSTITTTEPSEEELLDTLEKWYATTKRKEITLVTAGRSGVGKSTLIGNMLKLEGDAAPVHEHGPSLTTMEVKVWASTVRDVKVKIIDTPGLVASDVDELKSIAALQKESGGKADMLLYCVSLLHNSKIDQTDEKIIKKLTHVFGSEIWEHAILVFTSANVVKMFPQKNIPELVREYASKFQTVLQHVCPSFSVVSIFTCDQDQEKRDPSTIVALPAGLDPDEELIEGVQWDESIYLEVLKKCNPEAIPALLKVRGPTSWLIRRALAISGYIGLTGLGGVTGFGVGLGAGLVTAAGIGIAAGVLSGGAGRSAPAFLAQLAGNLGVAATIVGLGGGSAIGGVTAHSLVKDYEAEQKKLEKLQEGVQHELQESERSKKNN